jgi:site-specific DNA-methyltransferase (adenine-specific)
VIRLLSDPDETVLDCFMGSGTTAIAAIQENRQYIGIEIEKQYVELTRSKIKSGTQKRLISEPERRAYAAKSRRTTPKS